MKMSQLKPWKTLSSKQIFVHEPWIGLFEEEIELPNGKKIGSFFQLKGPDYAVMVAVTDSDEMVMVRQYKHGLRKVVLTAPAGAVDNNEAPLATAKRELLEETGFVASEWTPLGSFVQDSNRGGSTGHMFLARGAKKIQEPVIVDEEEIEVVLMPLPEVLVLLKAGEMNVLSAATAILMAAREMGK